MNELPPDDDLTVRLGQVEVWDEKHLLPVGPAGFSDHFLCGDHWPSPSIVTPVSLRDDGEIDWFGDNWCASCSDAVGQLPFEVRYMTAPDDGEGYSVVLR